MRDEVIRIKTKRCTRCKRVKSVDLFPRQGKLKPNPRSACKSCTSKIDAQWRKDNSEKLKISHKKSADKVREKRRQHSRIHHMKANYGLTWEQYEELVAKQNGKCAICKKSCTTGKRLGVDHDHKTGQIRGLLCANCNLGLGKLGDNIESIRKVMKYLEGEF